jgi:hypothetical protein
MQMVGALKLFAAIVRGTLDMFLKEKILPLKTQDIV